MDLKMPPAAGEAGRNRWENPNIGRLTKSSSSSAPLKITSGPDNTIAKHRLDRFMSPAFFHGCIRSRPEQQNKSLKTGSRGQSPVSQRELAERIIADALPGGVSNSKCTKSSGRRNREGYECHGENLKKHFAFRPLNLSGGLGVAWPKTT